MDRKFEYAHHTGRIGITRIIALILSTLMVCALAACGAGSEYEPWVWPAGVPGPVGTPAPGQTHPFPEEAWEPVSIRWFAFDENLNSPEWQSLLNRFQLEITPARGQLHLMAMANDLPDVFFQSWPGLNSFIQEDLVRAIPDEMLMWYPFFVETLAQGIVAPVHRDLFGGTWGIPLRPYWNNEVHMSTFVYRKDWAANVGFTEPPANMAELAEMLRRFTFDDPTRRGHTTYGFSGGFSDAAWFPFANLYNWVEEDGRLIPAALSRDMKDAVVFWNGLYREGAIDPMFTLANFDDFIRGFVGCMIVPFTESNIWSNIVGLFGAAHPGLGDPLDVIGFLPALPKDADSPGRHGKRLIDGNYFCFSYNVDDAGMNRVLSLMHYQMTWENQAGHTALPEPTRAAVLSRSVAEVCRANAWEHQHTAIQLIPAGVLMRFTVDIAMDELTQIVATSSDPEADFDEYVRRSLRVFGEYIRIKNEDYQAFIARRGT
jgi:ABC-type glycerol-3-phosphate transport system substrate-binding protein